MRLFSDIRRYWRLFVAGVILLFLSMTVNLFGVVDTVKLYEGNKGTESLFGNQIVCGGDAFGGFLLTNFKKYGGNRQLDTCNLEELEPYESSFNLVGRFYGNIYSFATKFVSIDPSSYIKAVQIFSALLSSVILAMFVVWVRANFKPVVAVTTLLLLALSPQLISNSATMITHFNFMSFVLLIYVLYFYRAGGTKKYKILFWASLGIIFCLKALISYEYITTFAAMVAAAIGYSLWIQRARIGVYLKELLLTGLVTLGGLVFALTIHTGVLTLQKGSIEEGIASLRKAALSRTTSEYGVNPYRELHWHAPAIYALVDSYVDLDSRSEARAEKDDVGLIDSIKDNLLSGLTYLMLPIVSIPIALKEPFATYLQSFAVFVIALSVLWRYRHKWASGKLLERKVGALYLAAVISLVGYLSWQILARNHSLIHPHLNGYTMYIPLALFGYVIIGLYIDFVVSRLSKTKR